MLGLGWIVRLRDIVRDLWDPPCCGNRRWRECCGQYSESSLPIRWRLRQWKKGGAESETIRNPHRGESLGNRLESPIRTGREAHM